MARHALAKSWLQSGRASTLPTSISEAFDDYVHALPWAGTTGLDWSRKLPSVDVNVIEMSPEQAYQWGLQKRLGAHDLAVWYSRGDGGIVTLPS